MVKPFKDRGRLIVTSSSGSPSLKPKNASASSFPSWVLLVLVLVVSILIVVVFILNIRVLRNDGGYYYNNIFEEGRSNNIIMNSMTKESSSSSSSSNVISTPKPTVIPFVVSMTRCGEDPFMEGAAVLKYSIHAASIHGNLGGRYDYKMIAIHHPDATECALSLKELGYELIERTTPIHVDEIEGNFLRERIENNGCCGAKELIKLEAYTLTQYPVVVHLDLDFVLLKPIDVLFDVMLDEQRTSSSTSSRSSSTLSEKYGQSLDLMWPNTTIPNKVNAFFTRDFGMVKYHRKYKPVQGGFLVIRPDRNVYNELLGLVKKGDFDENQGWGGVVGKFYGSMTIQGLLPYYYDVLHPGQSVDLNRCIHNQMADNPRDDRKGRCNTGQEECEDCRERPVEDIASIHFTNCLKPWHCMAHPQETIDHILCRKMHREWFRVRSDLEKSWGHTGMGNGTFHPDMFFGYCKRYGKKGYQLISRPFRSTF